jgi:hypothetical protein
MVSPKENCSIKANQVEGAPSTNPEQKSPELRETRVTPPGPGRIITGPGLAGAQLQQVLRQHDRVPPRATLGKQLVNLIRDWLKLH